MGSTKKVRKTGRLGSRYGVGIRKRLLKVEDKQQKNYACPFCGFKRVKRKAAGLYTCRKCNASFAGGAYLPVTLPGSIIKKTVAQKSFASKASPLEKITEQVTEQEGETVQAEKKPVSAKEEKKKKLPKEEKKKTLSKRKSPEKEKAGSGKKKQ